METSKFVSFGPGRAELHLNAERCKPDRSDSGSSAEEMYQQRS